MSETLRVRVKGGVLEPLEKLDLPEGMEVLVTILRVSPQANREAFRRSFGTYTRSPDIDPPGAEAMSASRLSTLKTRLARAQQRLRRFIKPGRPLSKELIAERREAARHE